MEKEGTPCEICGKIVEGYDPKYCCSGECCGCLAKPIEPCLCDSCWANIHTDVVEELRGTYA